MAHNRIVAIWKECLATYGGPYLFGKQPCIADAMYAPVVTRFLTYDVALDKVCAAYCKRIMELPAMQEWVKEAKKEPDDIDELDLAEGTYIEVTANVENKVPAYLTVKAYPVDAQGNKIEDKLLIEIPDEVAASTDGTTAVTTPITMKITPKVKNSLKQLDGLVFRLEGSAKSANGNKVTGISLNEREHTLKLNDIKVKIVGKIIGDFN